jgi:glutamine amidotransferase
MRVTVIDYGIGNLYSVCRALERCGGEVTLTADATKIEAAPRLVLPGVGAFADGMLGLRERGLVEPIQRYAASRRPLLGICLGMQMLASVSEEFGRHEGLGIIPGRVVPVPHETTDGRAQKIPHTGWNALVASPGADWGESLLKGTPEGTSVYLVHTYSVIPDDSRNSLADCLYGGHRITVAIRNARVEGCQFHPEKSGQAGLAMLAQFLHT